ncbi:hypothetical protein TrRE_jg8561, partial [Triparma retinervis]
MASRSSWRLNIVLLLAFVIAPTAAFTSSSQSRSTRFHTRRRNSDTIARNQRLNSATELQSVRELTEKTAPVFFGSLLSLSLAFGGAASPAFGEDELAAKYGNGKLLDTSLVDQACLVDKCSIQSKECLVEDPSCRKGLTCTAKCMGDNACITGCMARWGNSHLDNLLKCTIEENECIKVAILPGGGDAAGAELPSPIPTVPNFNKRQLEGRWYKVMGFNKNYDCYACQRNTFTKDANNKDNLLMDVEFSMPRFLEDGSPPPPSNKAEQVFVSEDGTMRGSKSIALNDYHTNEVMTFDSAHELD